MGPEPWALGGGPSESGPPPAAPEAGGGGAAVHIPWQASPPWTSTPTGNPPQAWGEGGSRRHESSGACPPRPSSQERGDSAQAGGAGVPGTGRAPGRRGGQAVSSAQGPVRRLQVRLPWTANLPEPQVAEEVTGNAASEHQTVVYLQEKNVKLPPKVCARGSASAEPRPGQDKVHSVMTPGRGWGQGERWLCAWGRARELSLPPPPPADPAKTEQS